MIRRSHFSFFFLILPILFGAPLSAKVRTMLVEGPDSVETQYLFYGPISEEDTLWSIADQVRTDPTVNMYQTMSSLYHQNPSSFEENSPNKLVDGEYLRIPTIPEIKAIPQDEAAAEFEQVVQNQPQSESSQTIIQSGADASSAEVPPSEVSSVQINTDTESDTVATQSVTESLSASTLVEKVDALDPVQNDSMPLDVDTAEATLTESSNTLTQDELTTEPKRVEPIEPPSLVDLIQDDTTILLDGEPAVATAETYNESPLYQQLQDGPPLSEEELAAMKLLLNTSKSQLEQIKLSNDQLKLLVVSLGDEIERLKGQVEGDTESQDLLKQAMIQQLQQSNVNAQPVQQEGWQGWITSLENWALSLIILILVFLIYLRVRRPVEDVSGCKPIPLPPAQVSKTQSETQEIMMSNQAELDQISPDPQVDNFAKAQVASVMRAGWEKDVPRESEQDYETVYPKQVQPQPSAQLAGVSTSQTAAPVKTSFVDIEELMKNDEAPEIEPYDSVDLNQVLEDFPDMVEHEPDLEGNEAVAAQLDLARFYLEVEDLTEARNILKALKEQGTPVQQKEISQLLRRL